MNYIYIIQDEDGYAVCAAFDIETALQIIKKNNESCHPGQTNFYTYREVKFYKQETTQINLINHAKIV